MCFYIRANFPTNDQEGTLMLNIPAEFLETLPKHLVTEILAHSVS
jgi:hypothetical protein